jgi:hypothetical protein
MQPLVQFQLEYPIARPSKKDPSRLEIYRPHMYPVVKRDRSASKRLLLRSRSTVLQLFAFTFMSCVPRT